MGDERDENVRFDQSSLGNNFSSNSQREERKGTVWLYTGHFPLRVNLISPRVNHTLSLQYEVFREARVTRIDKLGLDINININIPEKNLVAQLRND